jgi:NAD(P)-dependent dehydrogenase (short-subunit alcohol dehydrogenase family)
MTALPLAGRVAVVTGGASGIGAASARLLAARGARVVVCDIEAEGGEAVAREVGGTFRQLDVSVADAWEALDEPVDLLHLNAGVLSGVPPMTLPDLTAEAWARLRGVNVDGVAYGIARLAPAMAARGGGAIVVTASLAGLAPYPGDPFYSATKHLVVGLVRSLAPMLERDGIRINAICPDAVDSPFISEGERERWRGIMLEPEEVARVAVDLLGDGGTGEAWAIVHGRTPQPYRFRGVPGSPLVAHPEDT